MIVVADTTPLNYLILIEEIELLPRLYEKVLIPPAVHAEMLRPKAPPAVQAWASSLPQWCEIRQLSSGTPVMMAELDPGEREAIALALDSCVEMLLIDDNEGRREALRLSLKVAGTIAVLEKGSQRGFTDFRKALKRLDGTNFRISASIRAAFLARNP